MNNDMGLLVPHSGDKTRIICGDCGGGSTKERSLLVSNDNGRVWWYCFRDSCDNRGSRVTGFAEPTQEIAPNPLRPYTGIISPLTDKQRHYFKDGYSIDADVAGIKRDGYERYLLPIRTYFGDIMGYISRRPWDADDDGTPKSLTYWHERGPLLAWNAAPRYAGDRAKTVLAVEDQLSAIRAHQLLGVTTVALLGTGVNQEKIGAIQRHTDNLVIALDADATGQAFAMARKWGQAFKSCRVLVLDADIKDMHYSNLRSIVI